MACENEAADNNISKDEAALQNNLVRCVRWFVVTAPNGCLAPTPPTSTRFYTQHKLRQEKNKRLYNVFDFAGSCWLYGVPKRLPHLKIIGENIRRQRKTAGLSQEGLAEKADLHPVYFGQVERGEQAVSVHALIRIAKAMKIKLHDLVVGV